MIKQFLLITMMCFCLGGASVWANNENVPMRSVVEHPVSEKSVGSLPMDLTDREGQETPIDHPAYEWTPKEITSFLEGRILPDHAVYHAWDPLRDAEARMTESEKEEFLDTGYIQSLRDFFRHAGILTVRNGKLTDSAWVIQGAYMGREPYLEDMFSEMGMREETVRQLRQFNEWLVGFETSVNEALLAETDMIRSMSGMEIPYGSLSVDGKESEQLHEEKDRKLYTFAWTGTFSAGGLLFPVHVRGYLAKNGQTYYGLVLSTTQGEKEAVEIVTDKLMRELAETR